MNQAKIYLLEQQKKKTAHIVHFIITLFFWPWLLMWLFCHIENKQHNNYIDALIANEMSQNKD